MTELELTMCAGLPNKVDVIDTYTKILAYDRNETSPGLSLTLPVVGGLSLSSKQDCTALFRVSQGRVVELRYNGATRTSLFSRDGACEPIIAHCVEEPESIPVVPMAPSPSAIANTDGIGLKAQDQGHVAGHGRTAEARP
jgi:hypothetical protein